MIRIIMLGAPGSGKGTQSALIAEKYNIPTIATGDIFRKNIGEGTEPGRKAKAYMDSGELVPDDLVIEIATDRLKDDDCRGGFLLDGFPRTVYQAEALNRFLEERGEQLDKVIFIQVPEEELHKRLAGRWVCRECGKSYHIVNVPPRQEGICDSCGGELYQRADDSLETAKNRVAVYNEQTMPLVEFYDEKNILARINGLAETGDVFRQICEALGEAG